MATRIEDTGHGGAESKSPSPIVMAPEIELFAGAPCRCLPSPQGDWVACAYCGLRQAPGKEFCGFCGHRWVTDPDG